MDDDSKKYTAFLTNEGHFHLTAWPSDLRTPQPHFLRPKLEYLDHLITDEGVKPNPNKLESIKNFKE